MPSVAVTNQHAMHETFVEEFIASWNILQPDAEPVRDPSMLPVRVQQHAESLRKGYFWRAWNDDGRLRFVVMSLNCSGRTASGRGPVMEACFFDGSANLLSAGEWQRMWSGRWFLVDRLDPGVALRRHARPRLASRRTARPGTAPTVADMS